MTTTKSLSPEAYIAVGGNRQKIYSQSEGKKVFLEGGTEFQLELFNGTTEIVAAKIYINDEPISNSLIVLRPGVREFLDRYIDDNKKFLFDTYKVENSEAAKAAIAKNGNVRIDFFKAVKPQPINISTPNITTGGTWWPFQQQQYPYYGGNGPYYGTTNNPYYTNTNCTTNGLNIRATNDGESSINEGMACMDDRNISYSEYLAENLDRNISYSEYLAENVDRNISYSEYLAENLDLSFVGDGMMANFVKSDHSEKIETGRIEGGAASDQNFISYNGEFESFAFATSDYQILPSSTKPVEISKIRQYCPGCRSRIRKSTWKFCPACSEPLD